MDNVNSRSFTIRQVLAEAWRLVHEHKWHLWAIAIFIFIATLLVQFLLVLIFRADVKTLLPIISHLLMPLLSHVVAAPFVGGAVMTAVLCARHETVSAKTGFRYLNKAIPVMITMFLIALLANILSYLVHLPVMTRLPYTEWFIILAALVSVLVYVFLLLSVPLVIDKNKSPLEALRDSYQIIKPHWFKILILLVIVYLCFAVALIPLFISGMIHPYAKIVGIVIFLAALIWLMPFVFLVQGVLYHKLID